MNISLIVAVSENNVIGKSNKLIWHLPEDLKRFKKLTFGHHIIMGRKTYESIGKPLPGRTSVIVTRNDRFDAEGCIIVHTLHEAFDKAQNDVQPFVIGGDEIFKQALPFADTVYLTKIHRNFDGDTHFYYEFQPEKWTVSEEQTYPENERNPFAYSFITYKRKMKS